MNPSTNNLSKKFQIDQVINKYIYCIIVCFLTDINDRELSFPSRVLQQTRGSPGCLFVFQACLWYMINRYSYSQSQLLPYSEETKYFYNPKVFQEDSKQKLIYLQAENLYKFDPVLLPSVFSFPCQSKQFIEIKTSKKCSQNTFNQILIVKYTLTQYPNFQQTSLLLLLNEACTAEKQQISILL